MEKAQANNKGIGYLGLLTIVFITLKLTKVIDWSWWWVASPILFPFALFISVFPFALLISLKKTTDTKSKEN